MGMLSPTPTSPTRRDSVHEIFCLSFPPDLRLEYIFLASGYSAFVTYLIDPTASALQHQCRCRHADHTPRLVYGVCTQQHNPRQSHTSQNIDNRQPGNTSLLAHCFQICAHIVPYQVEKKASQSASQPACQPACQPKKTWRPACAQRAFAAPSHPSSPRASHCPRGTGRGPEICGGQ